MERKIAFQEILCETYNKDVMTKDSLLKRLKAENAGLREDIKNLQDEMLRVNAKRLDAEQHAMRLQQELQFSEEQISTLREKLSSSEEETTYFQRCIHVSKENSQANVFGESQLSELGNEIVALRGKCESYRDKLNDKERFLASVSKENEDLKRTVEAMKRDLSAMRSEERSLKIENERLQRENADRDIDRLSSETTAEVSTNKMSSMKHQLRHLESRVNELEIQQRDQENRETELSQEVLANLEKYTQVEQKLYLTRKELAQLQGFYESSQNKRRDLQQEVESSRRTIASLEKRLLDKKIHEEVEKGNGDAIKDNEGLHKEIQRLTEGFRTSQIEITELEKALQTAREQNSLQRLRLEAHDTLMERKDKRIKELQNELIELHNQIESLTDEILKNNRERESLRMAKRLLEQEVDLIKSRKLLGRERFIEKEPKKAFIIQLILQVLIAVSQRRNEKRPSTD
ncbi:uncharacterized protein [Montipora capricornis]|uniref:uncharacterized protein n=1 Tax=Montipora capricornis TaxID=246305 RepID=UPI0035F1C13B